MIGRSPRILGKRPSGVVVAGQERTMHCVRLHFSYVLFRNLTHLRTLFRYLEKKKEKKKARKAEIKAQRVAQAPAQEHAPKKKQKWKLDALGEDADAEARESCLDLCGKCCSVGKKNYTFI